MSVCHQSNPEASGCYRMHTTLGYFPLLMVLLLQKQDCSLHMAESLLRLAFDMEQADLSLIGEPANGGNLYLSRVLQEAQIEVAEEGTQAAAATMAELEAGGAMPEDLQIVQFNRSFLYMIMDMDSGAPVFIGILDKP